MSVKTAKIVGWAGREAMQGCFILPFGGSVKAPWGLAIALLASPQI